jgi:hypothetical protein
LVLIFALIPFRLIPNSEIHILRDSASPVKHMANFTGVMKKTVPICANPPIPLNISQKLNEANLTWLFK